MAHQSEYDFLFKVRRSDPRRACCAGALLQRSEPPAPPHTPAPQLLLIGDSGVGKSCLLLRFAVSAAAAAAAAAATAIGLWRLPGLRQQHWTALVHSSCQPADNCSG